MSINERRRWPYHQRRSAMSDETPCSAREYRDAARPLAPIALTAGDLTDTSCVAPGYPADRRAGAALADGIDRSGLAFQTVSGGLEATLSDLALVFPDRLSAADLAPAEAASTAEVDSNIGFRIVRVPWHRNSLLVQDLRRR